MRARPEEVAEVLRAVDKALGLPAPGVHVGGGVHVDMPAEWDGEGETPPGWTRTAAEAALTEDGTAELFLDAVTLERLAEPEARSRLGAAEAEKLAAAVATADILAPQKAEPVGEKPAEPDPLIEPRG